MKPLFLNNTITINLNELMESGDASTTSFSRPAISLPSLTRELSTSWSGDQARWFHPANDRGR